MKFLLFPALLACISLTACQSIATKEGSLSNDTKIKYVNIQSFVNEKTLACENGKNASEYSDFIHATMKTKQSVTNNTYKPIVADNFRIFGVQSFTSTGQPNTYPSVLKSDFHVNISKYGLHILEILPYSYSGEYGGATGYEMILQGSPAHNQAIAKQHNLKLNENLEATQEGNTKMSCSIFSFVV